MSDARTELRECAEHNGWEVIEGSADDPADVYRQAPFSVLVDFRKDDSVASARLFHDAPDPRQILPPRVIGEIFPHGEGRPKRVSVQVWLREYREHG